VRYGFVVSRPGAPKPATRRPRCPASDGWDWSSGRRPTIWRSWAGTPISTSNCSGRCRGHPMPTRRCAPWSASPRRWNRSGRAGRTVADR
jgi:hypothetical protein